MEHNSREGEASGGECVVARRQGFVRWVSQATGGNFRLASEAEWEKAARGVDGRVYPWGNQAPTGELCNFDGSKINDTTPVDRYPKGASPYGALDMAGNVWEWTLSLWGKDASKPQFGYPYKPTDGREDLQANIDIRRVLRGGSYYNDDRYMRCASRYYCSPIVRNLNVGFRVVCVSPPHHASGLIAMYSPLLCSGTSGTLNPAWKLGTRQARDG